MRVLLALITVGITIYAVVDCLRSTDDEVRGLPRPLWLLVTLIPLVGGIAWLTFGRAPHGRIGSGPSRVVAPDDDPEFLLALDRSFRERRRQAADDARRRRRQEEARRQAEAEDGEARRGRSTNGKPGNGKPGNGKSGNAKGGGVPGSDQPDGAAPSIGPDGDAGQTPA
jgi:hypothetical protein